MNRNEVMKDGNINKNFVPESKQLRARPQSAYEKAKQDAQNRL